MATEDRARAQGPGPGPRLGVGGGVGGWGATPGGGGGRGPGHVEISGSESGECIGIPRHRRRRESRVARWSRAWYMGVADPLGSTTAEEGR